MPESNEFRNVSGGLEEKKKREAQDKWISPHSHTFAFVHIEIILRFYYMLDIVLDT